MKKFTLLAAAAALATVGFAAPAAHARVYVGIDIPLVAAAPPVMPGPVVEVAPGPRPGWFWVPGHQHWNGGGYVWVRGHWAMPPRRGAVWIAEGWAQGPGGWRWRRGYWR